MSDRDNAPPPAPDIGSFLGEPTRRLEEWRRLLDRDEPFPTRRGSGLRGLLASFLERALGPVLRRLLAGYWDRQRVLDLVVLERLQQLESLREEHQADVASLVRSLAETREHLEQRTADDRAHGEQERRWDREHVGHLEARVAHVEALVQRGLEEVMRHTDALFGRLDWKMDRYRRESGDLSATLGAALARSEGGDGSAGEVARAHAEAGYVGFENRFRGTEAEIRERLETYLPLLAGHGPVLDLGAGRGEAVALLREANIEARGVDASEEMAAHASRRGIPVTAGDALSALAEAPAGSLGAVVSFHVIEHLPPATLDRLCRLAWQALRPGGLLVLETPSPLSLVVAARQFWLDPTHLRPVHPEYLSDLLQRAGFASVERLDLRPVPAADRLPEVDPGGLPTELAPLVDRLDALRDHLDELLYGFQDYAMVARKAARAESG